MLHQDQKLYQAIDNILWQDWDPIGINDNEEIRDEYQGYTPHIFTLKKQGADLLKIAQHLNKLETVSMGMSGNIDHCKVIAQKIIDL